MDIGREERQACYVSVLYAVLDKALWIGRYLDDEAARLAAYMILETALEQAQAHGLSTEDLGFPDLDPDEFLRAPGCSTKPCSTD